MVVVGIKRNSGGGASREPGCLRPVSSRLASSGGRRQEKWWADEHAVFSSSMKVS